MTNKEYKTALKKVEEAAVMLDHRDTIAAFVPNYVKLKAIIQSAEKALQYLEGATK